MVRSKIPQINAFRVRLLEFIDVPGIPSGNANGKQDKVRTDLCFIPREG